MRAVSEETADHGAIMAKGTGGRGGSRRPREMTTGARPSQSGAQLCTVTAGWWTASMLIKCLERVSWSCAG